MGLLRQQLALLMPLDGSGGGKSISFISTFFFLLQQVGRVGREGPTGRLFLLQRKGLRCDNL